jgi:IclR family transcriptional regulator, KDG regulon repressor
MRSPEMKSENLSSTEKALKILMNFVPSNQEMGTLEISKKLGIHKSTVSRLLHLLTHHGFLQQNSDNKKYCLGRSAAEIGNAATRSLNNSIVSIAQPYLNELSRRVGESVALEVLTGINVVLACHVEGQSHIRFSFQPNEQVPINVAAGAKAILAFSPPDIVDQFLKKKFTYFNAKTIMSKKEYRAVLEQVREKGLAFDRGERYEDSYAIGTPIFNHEKIPVAAVVIAAPAFRMTAAFLDEIVGPLTQTASEISQRLFHPI